MRNLFTISALLIGSAAFAQADPHAGHNHAPMPVATEAVKPAVAAQPAVETIALPETEFDFGKIPQGKPVTHIFRVINKGKDSLRINNVQASCGCTTPVWEQNKAIAPGGSTNITVGYNAAAAGPFSKFITIMYNNTESKQITIKGDVWATPAASAPEAKKTDNGME